MLLGLLLTFPPISGYGIHSSLQFWVWWVNFPPPNAMPDFDPPGLHVPGQRQPPWSPNSASYIPSCKISKPCLLPAQCGDGMSAASSLLSFPRKRIFHAGSSRHMEEDKHSSTWSLDSLLDPVSLCFHGKSPDRDNKKWFCGQFTSLRWDLVSCWWQPGGMGVSANPFLFYIKWQPCVCFIYPSKPELFVQCHTSKGPALAWVLWLWGLFVQSLLASNFILETWVESGLS